MLFSYGEGEYIEGSRHLKGEIVLSEHKLYLRSKNGDFTQTYIPLERIERIKSTFAGVIVFVRPSILEYYHVLLKGQRKLLSDLVKDLVQYRGLKKRVFVREWFDDST